MQSVTYNQNTITVGESVLINPDTPDGLPYVALVKGIRPPAIPGGEPILDVVWYYRPEEAVGGRKPYHGANELLLSDHADECSAATVLSRCKVTTLADYQKMGRIVAGTFYSRFAYRPSTRDFDPARVPIYCTCSQPYNPDRYMGMCDACEEWFHPECVGSTAGAMQNEQWRCPGCRGGGGGGAA